MESEYGKWITQRNFSMWYRLTNYPLTRKRRHLSRYFKAFKTGLRCKSEYRNGKVYNTYYRIN